MSDRTDQTLTEIGEKILSMLEDSTGGDWIKPWSDALAAVARPHNATTGKPYRGVNALWFWLTALDRDYGADGRWATYKQWSSIGAQVRRGEKSTPGVFWSPLYSCDTDGRTGKIACSKPGHVVRRRMFASSFAVFHASQVDGAPDLEIESSAPMTSTAVDRWIESRGARIEWKVSNSAHYRPDRDVITLPDRRQFDSAAGLYGTAFHELAHWTGHPDRLGRQFDARFGSPIYAREELVAELAAGIVSAVLGVAADPAPNTLAYLDSWRRVFADDPMAVYRVARDAESAAEFLIGADDAS